MIQILSIITDKYGEKCENEKYKNITRKRKKRTRSDVSFFDKFLTPNKHGGSFENCLCSLKYFFSFSRILGILILPSFSHSIICKYIEIKKIN